MSWRDTPDPVCSTAQGAFELLIRPKEKDLGGFSVRRVLPAANRRMVGPFIFFDHMGPAVFPPGSGVDVRPHPHIGLSTVTYLFDGELMHRDSLGYVQAIRPGAVNLMTAGRGIVHSERAGDDRAVESRLHGIQSWMALPEGDEECEPAFVHHASGELPEVDRDGARVRVIMGSAFGATSPVASAAATLYLDVQLAAGAELTLAEDYAERAVYVVTGAASAGGETVDAGVMAVLCPGRAVTLRAGEDTRLMVAGGEPLGQRHIWWNFVSSSRERIERARADWAGQRFEKVPGETEFIPLPER